MNIFKKLGKKIIIYLNWIEIKPIRIFIALKSLYWYKKDLNTFTSKTQWKINKYPCLFDRNMEGGTLNEYFFQDIYVAKKIIEFNPVRHIDVGSRIDGFIAHLACVRQVEVLDIRPITAIINGIYFQQADIENISSSWFDIADCVSCLHTLEHFGLGRYGDKINPDGWKDGLVNLVKILKRDGVLWLSVPVGIERVEFNAHRVFDPRTINNFALELGLSLGEFSYFTNDEIIVSDDHLKDFNVLANTVYALGIFKFTKK